ncbi:MAG: peptidoglycan-binding LysM, partial [Xanthobacteraceae bacterium]
MSRVVQLFCSRRVPQVAVLALMSVGVAACSADTSTRFSDNPFTTRSDTTGSVRGAPYAAPAPRVERQELPQYSRPQSPSYSSSSYSSSALPPPVSAPQSYPVPSGVSGGGRGVSSYDPPSHPRLESTGTVPAPRSVAAAPAPAPAHSKGTTIIVGTSDTLE